MFEFHKDRKRYFDMLEATTTKYIIPFIEEKFPLRANMRVLDIGSGDGGLLQAFINKGLTGVGVELDLPRMENAKKLMHQAINEKKVAFIGKNVYDINIETECNGTFDIIILKDVIEHIHDQQKLIGWMKIFLNEDGVIFLGFPPWYMPFGGHQQIAYSKLSKIPYIHLLPKNIYKWILKKNNEPVNELMEIRETGISIERFEKICKKAGYCFLNKRHFLLNPIYLWKFGWKPRIQSKLISGIPFFRNFLTTGVYYLIAERNKKLQV